MCGLTEHLKIDLSPKSLSVAPNSDLSSKISDISVMRRQHRVEKLEGVLDCEGKRFFSICFHFHFEF